jgi:hypothetical protein
VAEIPAYPGNGGPHFQPIPGSAMLLASCTAAKPVLFDHLGVSSSAQSTALAYSRLV